MTEHSYPAMLYQVPTKQGGTVMTSLYEALAAKENTRGMDSADIELCDKMTQFAQQHKDGLITKREFFELILVSHRDWTLI